MEYISAEEFLKQPHEIQKIMQDWFIEQFEESNDFDLFNYNGEDLCYKNILDRNCNFNVEDCIPLFTEGQLRKFIEDKTNCDFEIGFDEDIEEGEYARVICLYSKEDDTHTKSIQGLSLDLLQAYWKVACEIAKEE